MNNEILGVEINQFGIQTAVVNIGTNLIVPGTIVRMDVDTNETAENLIMSWVNIIKESHKLNSSDISLLGVAIPGPFDYTNGISMMKNQLKFDSLYKLNVKELLAEQLNISPLNIRMQNNTPCFLQGEVSAGSAQGYSNVLGFTLNPGLGSARYFNNTSIDADLWQASFKDGIAEDYLDTKWLLNRYKEFTGLQVPTIQELTELSKTDDGLGQIVFNEYSENFVSFLAEYVWLYQPDLVLIGGHNDAWNMFIAHVRDRLKDKGINVLIKQAALGDAAALMGAANLWQ